MFGSLGELERVPRTWLERHYLARARRARGTRWILVIAVPAAVYQLLIGAYRMDLEALLLGAGALLLADSVAKDLVFHGIVRRQAEDPWSRGRRAAGAEE